MSGPRKTKPIPNLPPRSTATRAYYDGTPTPGDDVLFSSVKALSVSSREDNDLDLQSKSKSSARDTAHANPDLLAASRNKELRSNSPTDKLLDMDLEDMVRASQVDRRAREGGFGDAERMRRLGEVGRKGEVERQKKMMMLDEERREKKLDEEAERLFGGDADGKARK